MGICASSAVRDVLTADDTPPPVARAAPSATTKATVVRFARFPEWQPQFTDIPPEELIVHLLICTVSL